MTELLRVRGAIATLLAALLASGCGGGGGGGSAPAAQASGSLSVAGCMIDAGAPGCQATISWSTANAASPQVMAGNRMLSTAASGTLSLPVGAEPLIVVLADGGRTLDEKTVSGACASASAWSGAQCQRFAVRTEERAATPFVEGGRPVTLEVVIFRPLTPGPHPALLFNHGSTGNGDDPSAFRLTYVNEGIARYFAERGWLVAFPQRRGRGASDGTYDEGFEPDRSRYSCSKAPALAGLERALQDADAALLHLQRHPAVDASRMAAGGWSRGGILALAHAGRRPDAFLGVVNFVGGWIGEGCIDSVAVNRPTFAASAAFRGPTHWIYAHGDSFYSIAHSQANFDAFAAAGGLGQFLVYTRAPGLNGHFVINDPPLWGADLGGFLARLGG